MWNQAVYPLATDYFYFSHMQNICIPLTKPLPVLSYYTILIIIIILLQNQLELEATRIN